MHSIHIDDKEFEFVFNRGRSIIPLRKDCNYKKIESGSLVQIVCDTKTLIAEFYNIYYNFEEIQPHQNEFCYPKISNPKNDNMWIEIFSYRTESSESTALVPATLLLYHNIQWLRHLQLKKRLFKFIPTKKTKDNFNNKLETIDQTIEYLKGNIDVEILCKTLSNENDDTYNHNDIIEFLRFYSILPRLNEFREERLTEISMAINGIKKLYSERKYLALRQIAYDIHNVPEFIRTMNDYRNFMS